MPTALGTVASHRTASAPVGPVLTGLVGWWDADDASTFTFSSGASVSQWNDKSGNNYHATWVNSSWPATRVAAAINGKAAMDFHPGSLNTTLPSGTKPVQIMMAVKTGSTSGLFALIGSSYGFGPTGTLVYDSSDGLVRLVQFFTAAIGSATSPFTANAAAVLGFSYDAANVWTHYRDGAQVGTGTTAVTLAAAQMGIGGAGVPNGYNYDGQIGEVLVYNLVLSTVERQQVQSYLKGKWNTP